MQIDNLISPFFHLVRLRTLERQVMHSVLLQNFCVYKKVRLPSFVSLVILEIVSPVETLSSRESLYIKKEFSRDLVATKCLNQIRIH